MAKENEDDLPIELEDEGSVTIDLDDDTALKAETPEPAPEPKAPIPRKRLQEPVEEPKADETTKALQESLQRAEAARAAAEAQAAQERQRAQQAREAAERHRAEAEEAREAAETSQLAGINNVIESTQAALDSYQAEHMRAQEAGDFAEVAKLQVKISQAAAKLDRMTDQKERLVNAPKRVPERSEAPQHTGNVVEQYLSGFNPTSAEWLRNHPECLPAQYGGNPAANAKMMQGHYAALAQNVVANTPDYFRIIEEHTGHRQAPEAEASVPAQRSEPAKRTVLPSAPPSREAPATPGVPRNVRQVVLTKEQREMAKMSFPQLTEQQAYAQYAKNMVELQAEGKLGRTTH